MLRRMAKQNGVTLSGISIAPEEVGCPSVRACLCVCAFCLLVGVGVEVRTFCIPNSKAEILAIASLIKGRGIVTGAIVDV